MDKGLGRETKEGETNFTTLTIQLEAKTRGGKGELVERSGGKQPDQQTRTSEREHKQSKCWLAEFF